MKNALLEGYPVIVEFPIAWGEMDAFQHVNNVAYFRYFENARVAYSAKLELHTHREQTGIGPILGSASCIYKFPLTYPDTISVAAKIVSIAEDRFTMKHLVVSHRHQKVAAEGEGVIVMYDYHKGEKTLIPELIRQKIALLEKL